MGGNMGGGDSDDEDEVEAQVEPHLPGDDGKKEEVKKPEPAAENLNDLDVEEAVDPTDK